MFWRAAAFSLFKLIQGAGFSSSMSPCLSFPVEDLEESDPFDEMAFEVEDKDLLHWEYPFVLTLI